MSQDRGEMPFLDHLEELRHRILWSLLAVAVGTAIGIWTVFRFDVVGLLNAPLFDVVQSLAPTHPELGSILESGRLTYLDLTEPLFFKLRFGLILGLVLSSPVIVSQAWGFLAPALEKHERRWIIVSMAMGVVLFAVGVAMAYLLVLPLAIRFLLVVASESFVPSLTVGYYFSLVTKLLVAFGLAFELPVLIMILSALGLITPRFLRAKRRHAAVGMFVVAAVITPFDAPMMMIAMGVPLLVLYEAGIMLSVLVGRTRQDAPPEQEPPAGSVALLIALASWRARTLNQRLRPSRAS